MESSVEFAQNDITANIAFGELYTMVKKRRKGKMSCISPSEERDVFERQQPISGSGTCWLVSNSGMSQKLTMESCGKFEAPSKHPAAETDSMMLF